jgi:hypothetical protein
MLKLSRSTRLWQRLATHVHRVTPPRAFSKLGVGVGTGLAIGAGMFAFGEPFNLVAECDKQAEFKMPTGVTEDEKRTILMVKQVKESVVFITQVRDKLKHPAVVNVLNFSCEFSIDCSIG